MHIGKLARGLAIATMTGCGLVAASPLGAVMQSAGEDVIRCNTPTGFYVWRIDRNGQYIVEHMSRVRLDVQNFGNSEIRAGYYSDHYTLELDLSYSEAPASNGNGSINTYHSQRVRSDRGGAVRNYQGPCHRIYIR